MKPLFSFWKKVQMGTTYFGNCQSDGTPPAAWGTSDFAFYGPRTWYGNTGGPFDFTCEGTGPQRVNFMGVYGKTRGSPHSNVRMSIYTYDIYDPTLVLVCQWDAARLVDSATAQWWDKATFTGTAFLTGGQKYRVAVSGASALFSYAYTTGSVTSRAIGSADYTASGFPSTLGAGDSDGTNLLMRVNITGDRTPTPAVTREEYYVDTDYAGGGSTGSPAKPYTNLQTALAARCNKTFTLPIYIYCSGAADDTIAVNDGALGQMGPTSTNRLYIIGNRTASTWDISKYKLVPADRTGYYGAINFNHPYVHMDRLQVYLTSTTPGFANEVVYLANKIPGSTTFSNGIVRAPGGTDATRYFSSSDTDGGITIWNTLMYGIGTSITSNGIKNHGATHIYSCTILGAAGNGIDNTVNSTVYVDNCYVERGIVGIPGGSTENIVTTATGDNSGTSGLRNIPANASNFVSVTLNNEDLRPIGTSLIGTGTDTSGSAAPLNFTTDIAGAVRVVPWDIGAINH